MKAHASTQYTIRNIPRAVDHVLRQRARQLGKSFNQVAVDALAAGAGVDLAPKRDLTGIVGSMTEKEANRIDAEIRAQRRIDPDLWR